MSNLKRKALLMFCIEILCLAFLGTFLFNVQNTISLESTHTDIQQKLDRMQDLYATAKDSGAQVTESYDEVYQGKANALALMAARTEKLTPSAMETFRELLNVDNVLILDHDSNTSAKAKVSPADFKRARYNRVRSALAGTVPAPFEVTYRTGTTYRYYAAKVDVTHIAVIEHAPTELDTLLDDTSTWNSVLRNVSVGLNGFAFAVSGRSYNFVYFPDDSLIGKDALDNGVSATELEKGNFCWMTLGGQKYYCGVTEIDGTYVICAVSQQEINSSRNVTVFIVLFAFFLVITIIIIYAILFMRRENGNAESVKLKFGSKLYYDKGVGLRIGSIAVIGLVCIIVISLYMQTLYSLSRHSMSNNQRVAEVEASIEKYYADRDLITNQYNRRYINKAKAAAYILTQWPDLRNREDLETLSRAINVDWIIVFDNSGSSTAGCSPYGTFTLSTNPEDQSYVFRKLLNGAPSVLQEATEDELSGEYRQYIGYQLLDESGNSDGFIQIAVQPSRLEAALDSTDITSILSGISVGTDGFAFAVNKEEHTFSSYPNEKLVGRNALDYGMTETQLADGFCDFISVNGIQYYASCMETDKNYVFVAVPASEVDENNWPVTLGTAGFSAICLLIVFLLLSLRRTESANGTDAGLSPDDKQKSAAGKANPMIDVKLTDGTVKKSEAAASRWDGMGIAWQHKSPEQQVASILQWMVSALAVAICIAVIFKDRFFDSNSIFNYIISGRWQHGVNIFSITGCLLMICVISVVTMILRRLLKILGKTMDTRGDTICRLLRSFLKYISVIVALYYCLSLFGVDTTTLLASAGILSLVIGLGANTLVSDILAGLFIIFEGEFRVGDIVTVGGWRGTVQEIGVRTTKIEDGAKNVKIISNRDVNGIINMTRQFSFAVCDVGIEYGESLERVENVLAKELPRFKKRLTAIESGPFYKGVVSLGESSVNIRIVAECSESNRFQLERDLNREIKLLFDHHNIGIPFPQVVVNQPTVFTQDDEATQLEKRRAEAFNKQQADLSKDIVTDTGN